MGNFTLRFFEKISFCLIFFLASNSIVAQSFCPQDPDPIDQVDLRGRVPMHAGNGPGLTSRRLGEKGGVENNILNVNQLPPHTHSVSIPSKEEGNADVPADNYVAGAGLDSFGTTTESNMKPFQTLRTGGGQSVNNIQPYQCVNYNIALVGIFPSRA